jgi:hypothetical protein
MGAHTKGPWEFGPGYKPGDTRFDLFAPGGKQVIAQASYENMWLATYDVATDAANARLIASAPDLLKALLELVDHADQCIARLDHHDAGMMGNEPIDAARAAIARATGEAS